MKYKDTEYKMLQMEIDSTFISMFNISVLDGKSRLILDKNEIAITEEIAKQIFGKENPIGKQLLFPQSNNSEKTIVAIVKSWKGHSLLSFDILLSYEPDDLNWNCSESQTFLRFYPDSDIKVLEQRLTNYEIEQDSH